MHFYKYVAKETGLSYQLCKKVLYELKAGVDRKLYPDYKTKVVFADYTEDKMLPNMNASFPGIILVNVRWGCLLMEYMQYNKNPIIMTSFFQTIGHELGHWKDKRVPFSMRYHRLYFYMKEIYADYYSSVLFPEYKRDILLSSMKYKLKQSGTIKDTGDCCHPARRKRMYYIRYWDFTEALIRQVAENCGCADKAYIEKIIMHYQGKWIYLN